MEVSLKCQFCTLDFNSAYKMIPHVYFGHRKKISRQVRDQRTIFLKCPAPGCDFSHSNPVEDPRPEIIFSTLADMFLVVEDHIVTVHTREKKLVECPYCSLQLTNCVYWVHLEAHMNSTSSPATPVSRPVSATSKTPESPKVAPTPSEAPIDIAIVQLPDSQRQEKEEVQSLPSQSIESQSTDIKDVKVAENVDRESNIGDTSNSDVSKGTKSGKITKPPRSQILKDLEEINKKIALKIKEDSEAKMAKMECDESAEENIISDNKESRRDEESITSSEIQMKVEKHIDETILQNDQIEAKSAQSAQVKVEEQSPVEVQFTVAGSEIKEERKKVAAQEENDDKPETVKPRSREISGENDTGSRRRSISGEKRRTRTSASVWNREQQTAAAIKIPGITTVETKSKPVLTEEMERRIIYGNFKMKDPASRDDKRVAVKREIENLFKEEEEKKKRINEEKRKAEEKEREKFRIAEERLRKEREKSKEEKKRNKQRRKETKEDAEESLTENVEIEAEAEDDPKQQLSTASSPTRTRSKSPDQYQKIQFEISKMFKENETGTRAEKRPLERDSQSPEDVKTKIARTVPPTVVSYKDEEEDQEEEEDDDDLEIMMREFQERQTTSAQQMKPKEKSLTTESLSLIQSSYNSEMKDPTPSSVFDVSTENSPAPSPVISLSLSCNFCREEEGSSADYKSAYQLLAHVFLAHRKKIVSGSRKSGEMSLTCPENCGFVCPASSEGKSIDYFNSELAVQLSWLCDHMTAHHTGEDKLLHCTDCGLGLELDQVWAWQHLANHTDSRRQHCRHCNNFPFRNEKHRCNVVQPEGENDSQVEQIKLTEAERDKEEESWKYDQLAHKYGEVFCSVCLETVLGHHWSQHKLACLEPPSCRVNIVKYRGDTWLQVGETKVKVFYQYDDQATLAKCSFNQSNFTGSGINHEKAEDVLRQEVATFVSKSKVKAYFLLFLLSHFYLLFYTGDRQCQWDQNL